MKRYKVSFAESVNNRASKNGIKYRYAGKFESWKEFVEERTRLNPDKIKGFKVVDTLTGETVAEQLNS